MQEVEVVEGGCPREEAGERRGGLAQAPLTAAAAAVVGELRPKKVAVAGGILQLGKHSLVS